MNDLFLALAILVAVIGFITALIKMNKNGSKI